MDRGDRAAPGLTGGTAYALDGTNTVFTDDIVNDEVRSADVRNDDLMGGGLRAPDLRTGSVRSSEALDNSLTGADIAESTLRRVPSARTAALGGRGRGGPVQDACNPTVGAGFETCATVELTIPPAPGSRVLVIGRVRAFPEPGSTGGGIGECRLGTSTHGPVPDTSIPVFVDNLEVITLVGVTPLMDPGPKSFGIDCSENDTDSVIDYDQASVQAVALAPG